MDIRKESEKKEIYLYCSVVRAGTIEECIDAVILLSTV